MGVRGRLAAVGAAALLTSAMWAAPANAEPAKDAVESCRAFDEAGVLDEVGVTFGECVNILKGPASQHANNFVAGLCGEDFFLEFTGTTNKGQCIKVLKGFFF